MAKSYDTEPVTFDEAQNLDNGSIIKKITVGEWADFMHHTHSDQETTAEQATAVMAVMQQMVEALDTLGVDTAEIEAALESAAESAGVELSSSDDSTTDDNTDDGDGDDDTDDGDEDGDDEEEDPNAVEVTVNGTSYSFTTTYETEAEEAAVTALEAAIESDEDESEFDAVVDEESVLGEYLGCYEVSAETGVLTLASPVEVTDPEVYDAIVLHYNTETNEWEQVSDVQIVDGYVYAVFESLSPVAVYLLKKKYVATVTIGDAVTQYETIAEAVEYAQANLTSVPVVALTWDKCITETIGPLYSTATGNMTFDLAGYTIYASVEGGAAIKISGDASTASLVVQNGTIVCDDVTTCGIDIYDIYTTLNDLSISTCCVGAAGLKIDGVKAYPTNCTIATENGYGVVLQATDVAGLTSVLKTCTVVTTNTGDNKYPALYAANVNENTFLMSISGCTIDGDVYGIYNDSINGKTYIAGGTVLTAPTAVYISANHANTNGFYTNSTEYCYVNGAIETHDATETQGIAIKLGYFTATLEDAWMSSGYRAYTNEDEVYVTIADIAKIVECTTANGTVTYKNGLTTAAFSAAGTGGTVKMLEDYSAAGLTPTTSGVTVDMDGHTMTVTGVNGVSISSTKGIEMTLKNGTIKNESAVANSCAVYCQIGTINLIDMNIVAVDDGETNLNGVVCGNISKDYAATINISGNTTIDAPTGILVQNKTGNTNVATVNVGENTVITARSYAITGNGSYDGTVINVEGGTFTCTGNGAALYHPQAGTLTINGGTFVATYTGIQICDGDATINDATVTVTGEDDTLNKSGDGNIPDAAAVSIVNRSGYSSTYPTLIIKGGTFKSTNGKALKSYAWANDTESTWDASDYVNVYGGNFSDVIDSGFLAEGCTCSSEATDGLYTVSSAA